MEHLEKNMRNLMKDNNTVQYPDFEKMWDSIQQNELRASDHAAGVSPVRPRTRKRAAVLMGLSVALIATPVYAAIQYDWSNLLSQRPGIQAALHQGLGQKIEQSVTRNGITLTVHTAFTDENRTILLYTLDPGESMQGAYISYDRMGLLNADGKWIEGNHSQQYDEQLGVFKGYFESEWVMDGRSSEVSFQLENLQFTEDAELVVSYDPKKGEKQEFEIGRDGIGRVALQSFPQSDGKVMISSAVTFSQTGVQQRSWVRMLVKDSQGQPMKEAESGIFGTPGGENEIINQQVFKESDLKAEGTEFKLGYTRTAASEEGTWDVGMNLSKKQMENSSFQDELNIPVPEVPGGTTIHEMIVTPTQVRLILKHEEKYTQVPYNRYKLKVGGTLLEGGNWYVENPNATELRFEMNGLDAAAALAQPVTLIAEHRIDDHEGDGTPIPLRGITNERQSINMTIGGHPVTFTYYMKDGHLYVESSSTDKQFGGVNQTYYIADDKDRSYGKPAMTGLRGDGRNRHMDVYEDFKGSDLDVYVWRYMTEKPDDTLKVQLKQGK
ncbi:DUF4179 domain-containing protein [Paenibacillus lemnae]|uniref:DUF4179 domain-containing protein n=1 Tax=Paenibacillus lemnae TaxID=1330551 RepID=A0A848MA78_PAELE|nr:DUF4179 domain-containing protein [Paenibacillus lemnae]NMO97575.1 DUF4179 domain-containing protein [Paenibacillus lemnae]